MTESKFKVGDIVQYVKHEWDMDFKFFKIGKLYDVDKIKDDFIYLNTGIVNAPHVTDSQIKKLTSIDKLRTACKAAAKKPIPDDVIRFNHDDVIKADHDKEVGKFISNIQKDIVNKLSSDYTDGLKHDGGKLQHTLVPVEIYDAIADVMTYGAEKYKPNSWKQVGQDRYYSAALRHLFAWKNGEKYDPESGRHHLAHVLTNIGFMLWMDIKKGFGIRKKL